jgi:hypothetical protein
VNCRKSKVGNKSSRGYVESPAFWKAIAKFKKLQEASCSEILRINNDICSLEAKIRAGVANSNMKAVLKRALARTTTVGQTESTNCSLASDTRSQIVTGMNEVSIC